MRIPRVAPGVMAIGFLSIAALVSPTILEANPLPCLFRRFGHPCPGCGMARALSWLLHGHPRRAWERNPRVFLVAPLLAWLVIDGGAVRWRQASSK
ncbi:MAG: DUF2752 domain-containing protein [Chloroflexi bacterium]|nr:DUF2752 domain-containing protein [Chloroflexota bacterium]